MSSHRVFLTIILLKCLLRIAASSLCFFSVQSQDHLEMLKSPFSRTLPLTPPTHKQLPFPLFLLTLPFPCSLWLPWVLSHLVPTGKHFHELKDSQRISPLGDFPVESSALSRWPALPEVVHFLSESVHLPKQSCGSKILTHPLAMGGGISSHTCSFPVLFWQSRDC